MPTISARAVARAATIVGGVDLLAVELGIQPKMIGRYIGGESAVPQVVLDRAIEIITAAGVTDAANVRPQTIDL